MIPPLSNTGGNKPARLTRDERLVLEGGSVKVVCAERQQANQSGVIVDYLRITVRRDALLSVMRWKGGASDDDVLTQALAFEVAGVLGFVLGESRNGRDFYAHTWTVLNGFGKEVASVSGGGEKQRDTFCVTLKGEACSFAAKGWEQRFFGRFEAMGPKVTRIDLARDFLNGEVTIEEVEGHYFGGSFDYRNRRPSYTRHGSGDSHVKHVGHSRTFQVGQRESGKLLRAYEKGHAFRLMNDLWLRLEVELRDTDRIVPFEALIRPADFFAGAYDFCQMVLDVKPPEPARVPTGRAVGERTLKRFAQNVANQMGPTISVLMQCIDDAAELSAFAVVHAHRPVPRMLKGLDHAQVRDGIRKWLASLSEVVPANPAPSM